MPVQPELVAGRIPVRMTIRHNHDMQRLSGIGVWSAQLRYGDPGEIAEAAAELDELGYAALWIPDVGGDLFASVELLLQSTQRSIAATGILNLWMHTPEETSRHHARLTADHGDRWLVGIGVSHAPLINRANPGRYARPLSAMARFLDGLDKARPPLDHSKRVLAALGPRMLQLARERSAGVHPYNVTPDHTSRARVAMGPEAMVLPEQAVVLTSDPERARRLGRKHLEVYLPLPNYALNLRRLGFGDEDFADGGSNRLIDSLVAWGDPETIRTQLRRHFDAGADHVAIQVLSDEGLPRAEWRELAPALIPD
jgi:probable F420-dependent oxidoreductase